MKKRSPFKTRTHPTQSLGAGEISSNLPNQTRYPKETVGSEIDTVSDYTSTGRRAVISSPGHPFGGPTRRSKKRRR